MSRREQTRLEFQVMELATEKAFANGLCLTILDIDDGSYRLTYSVNGALRWSVDLWPTFDDGSRVSWHPDYKGPVLPLPRPWTILDAVNAMIEMKNAETAKPGERKRPKPTMGVRKRRR